MGKLYIAPDTQRAEYASGSTLAFLMPKTGTLKNVRLHGEIYAWQGVLGSTATATDATSYSTPAIGAHAAIAGLNLHDGAHGTIAAAEHYPRYMAQKSAMMNTGDSICSGVASRELRSFSTAAAGQLLAASTTVAANAITAYTPAPFCIDLHMAVLDGLVLERCVGSTRLSVQLSTDVGFFASGAGNPHFALRNVFITGNLYDTNDAAKTSPFAFSKVVALPASISSGRAVVTLNLAERDVMSVRTSAVLDSALLTTTADANALSPLPGIESVLYTAAGVSGPLLYPIDMQYSSEGTFNGMDAEAFIDAAMVAGKPNDRFAGVNNPLVIQSSTQRDSYVNGVRLAGAANAGAWGVQIVSSVTAAAPYTLFSFFTSRAEI